IVQYYCRRPQVQERLTVQIANELMQVLETPDVAVLIDAKHMCVSMRGIEDHASSTVTSYYGGKFAQEETKQEFVRYLGLYVIIGPFLGSLNILPDLPIRRCA